MIRDSVVFRSIPFVTTGLAFLPACGGDDGVATGSDDDSTSSPSTMTMSASDSSASADDDDDDTSDTDINVTLDGSSTEDGSSSDSGDPLCGGGSCNAVAPVGWFGPVTYAVVEPGAPMPGCPDDVLEAGPTVLDGFVDPGPAVCTCECELSAPLTCNSCMETSASQNCQNGGGYYGGCPYNNVTVTDDCTNVDILGFLSFSSTEQGYYYGGGGAVMCEEESEDLIPPFAWQATIATCRVPDTALACTEGICVPPTPEGFEAKWCIYQTGDLECTDANFPVKSSFWTEVEDTRSCTNCQCGTADQSCDGLELQVFGGPDCAGEPVALIGSDNICTAALGQSVAGDFGEDGGCPVTEAPVAQGTIMPTGPFTFCCSE
jgi:hypothetical protein